MKIGVKITVYSALAVILVAGVIALVIIDERKAGLKALDEFKRRYLEELAKTYAVQDDKAVDMTLDEARKEMPKVDKIDFKP